MTPVQAASARVTAAVKAAGKRQAGEPLRPEVRAALAEWWGLLAAARAERGKAR